MGLIRRSFLLIQRDLTILMHPCRRRRASIRPFSDVRRVTSAMEARVATSNLPHMVEVLSNLKRATRSQMRTALLFWMSKPVQELGDNARDPLEAAKCIVDHLHNRFQESFDQEFKLQAGKDLEFVLLGTDSTQSCNLTLSRLISAYLQPLQGTFASLKQSGLRKDFSAKENVERLLVASHLHEMHLSLLTDNQHFPLIQPDHLSLQTHLNLIGKRTKFLVFCLGKKPFPGRHSPRIRRGVQWSAPSTQRALGHCETVQELIDSAHRAVAHHKVNPLLPLHYSMIAAIYADASYLENGMADAAAEFLRQELRTTHLPSTYNPVLLAYTREAEDHRKAARHAAALHAQTQGEAIFAQIKNPDAISYSVLLKLYKHTPKMAQEVLDGLLDPKTIHYNAVLDAWAKAGRPQQALELLRRMENLGMVDRISYTTVLECCADNAKDILDQCVANPDPNCRPDAVTYNSVFNSYFRRLEKSKFREDKAAIARHMHSLLEHVVQCPHFQSVVHNLGYQYYNTVLRAYAYAATSDSVEQSLALLDTMTDRGVSPSGQTYQNILASIAFSGGSIDAAAKVFEKMEAQGIPRTMTAVSVYLRQLLRMLGNDDDAFGARIVERLEPKGCSDSFAVGYVFEGLMGTLMDEQDSRKKYRVAERIEKLFYYLKEREYDVSYNECFRAWAFSLHKDATRRTLRLLKEMKQCGTTPDAKTYEYILTCFSRNTTTNVLDESRAVFAEMKANNLPVSLSIVNCFLRILVRSGKGGANVEAESILASMENESVRTGIVPNETSYELVWRSYLRSGSLDKADSVLERMERFAVDHPGVAPTVQMHQEMMTAWSESLTPNAMQRVEAHFNAITKMGKPDSELYGSLQAAWCKRRDSSNQVEAILVKMQSDFESGNNPLCRPKVPNFNAVIYSLANEGNAERAEAVLARMEELSKTSKYAELAPTTACYEAAIRGWSMSTDPEAGERSLRLLETTKQAWASGKEKAGPSLICYNGVLTCLVKSRHENKAQQSYLLLKEMIVASESKSNRVIRPTNETFLNVLRCCATSAETDVALHVVLGTMEDYLQLFSRNLSNEVFVQFLYALFRLVPAGKSRDEAALCVLLDEKCPSTVLNSYAVRDALAKTVSQEARSSFIQIHDARGNVLRQLMTPAH